MYLMVRVLCASSCPVSILCHKVDYIYTLWLCSHGEMPSLIQTAHKTNSCLDIILSLTIVLVLFFTLLIAGVLWNTHTGLRSLHLRTDTPLEN